MRHIIGNPRSIGAMTPLLLAAMAPSAHAADAPTGGIKGSKTFVLTNIYIAGAAEPGSCTPVSTGGVEAFYSGLSPAEQAEYAPADKRQALERLMAERLGFKVVRLKDGDADHPGKLAQLAASNNFPANRGRLAFAGKTLAYSSCTDPQDFPQLARGYRPYDGMTAEGIDLDGKRKKSDFRAPSGEAGVDNQLWRAIGCNKGFRESIDAKAAREVFISARAPTLIELNGVDDAANDPDITVTVSAAADPVTRDGRGEALSWATFSVDPDPQLRTTVKGRIVDGVVTTDPFDVRLNYKEQIIDAPRDLRKARLRMKIAANGSVEGHFYGYQSVASVYSSIEQMTQAGANVSGVSCPALRIALDKYADGYPDPRTGRNTAISAALGFVGVPAFAGPPPATSASKASSQ